MAHKDWSWDSVLWSSHCGNCIANCAYRLFMRDGQPVWEEQSGDMPAYEGVPDMNPLGCQKGAAWLTQLTCGDRLTHPLRRVGERGSGRWERISWEEAFDAVADAVIDALEADGSHSVIVDEGAEGGLLTGMARARFANAIDAVSLDGNSTVSDIHLGHWMTFGNLLGGSTADDTFRADVILVWNANPAFTRIPYYHYLPEARYRGARVVTIAPDYSPSAVSSDIFVPVVPGSDAALALSMCQVIVEEDLLDRGFVCSQTDLPFLVKADGRFLRASDVEIDGRTDRFYVWRGDTHDRVDPARLDDAAGPPDVELEGEWEVTGVDGEPLVVTTVFELMRRRLDAYPPEAAAEICGVAPGMIRELARLIARNRTKLYNGLGSCKHYHGDLMERSMDLVLALTGNWGKAGTGFDTYIIALLEGEVLGLLKARAGVGAGEETLSAMEAFVKAAKDADPAATDGRAVLEMMRRGAPFATTTPPAFFLYYHCGFEDVWNEQEYGSSPRPMREYVDEALARGWWGGLVRPDSETAPRVLIQAGTNTLRRTRGGQREMLRTLWPGLDMVVLIDWRMNMVGLEADIVLPVACEAEKLDLHAANSHSWERMLSDKAVEPAGEARSDWQIFQGLTRAIVCRAASRGLMKFKAGRGMTRPYAKLLDSFTMRGAIEDDEVALDEVLRDSSLSGNLPAGTSLARLRETGWVRPERLPLAMRSICGAEISDDGPMVAYADHVAGRVPFPTLTGRAQFLVDHDWFFEADEHLPRHKPPPRAGGSYPLQVTGGHPRWSIHATNTTNRLILGTTRGHPVLHLNPGDAAARNVEDEDVVRVWNDLGAFEVHAKISPAVRPGQVIIYASWEAFLFPEWKDATLVEPGMVKWLHFAGGYGHLGYSALQWQPIQADRLHHVEVARA